MSSIVSSSQSIQQINSQTWFTKFDIQTSVTPSIKFDLTTDHGKPVNLIVSNDVYSRFQSDLSTRVNSNSHEIKLYSYNGKELSRIEPKSKAMGCN